jgi:hypothetical protein
MRELRIDKADPARMSERRLCGRWRYVLHRADRIALLKQETIPHWLSGSPVMSASAPWLRNSFPTVAGEFEFDRPLHEWILVAALSSNLRPTPASVTPPSINEIFGRGKIMIRYAVTGGEEILNLAAAKRFGEVLECFFGASRIAHGFDRSPLGVALT